MRARECLVLSLVAGCGLVQVNGKPLGGSSSPPPSTTSSQSASSSSSPSSEPSSTQAAYTEPAARAPNALVAEREQAAEPSGKRLRDFGDPGAKRQAWTPVMQFKAIDGQSSPYPALIIADELGDRLSHAGRIALIQRCLERQQQDVSSAVLWATCGGDVEAFDMSAFGKELQKEGLHGEDRKELLAQAAKVIEGAKVVGAAVAAAAQEDPGVAAIVTMGSTARQEWKRFASEHADQLTELGRLEDLVREEKNGMAGDCIAKTQPALEKAARATKWREKDIPIDPSDFYVNQLPKTPEAFIAVAAWGACVALTHDAGNAIYGSATRTRYGYSQQTFRRYHRRGPRSLTVAKIYDGDFKPKFASRKLDMRNGFQEPHGEYGDTMRGVQTPAEGVVAKLVKNGEETTIKFAKDKVSLCAEWRDTNRVQSVSAGGSLMYEKKCMRREMVSNQTSDVVTATVFLDGVTPGAQLTSQYGFPIVAVKGNKFVAALGVKL